VDAQIPDAMLSPMIEILPCHPKGTIATLICGQPTFMPRSVIAINVEQTVNALSIAAVPMQMCGDWWCHPMPRSPTSRCPSQTLSCLGSREWHIAPLGRAAMSQADSCTRTARVRLELVNDLFSSRCPPLASSSSTLDQGAHGKVAR